MTLPRRITLAAALLTAVPIVALLDAARTTAGITEWPAVAAESASTRLEGEFGLWVRWRADTLDVSWITRDDAAGFLEIVEGTRPRFHTETAAGRRHNASLPKAGTGSLLLRYGALNDSTDRHETLIRPRPGRPRLTWTAVDSVVVVSDIHGEFDRLTRVLRNAGIIDERLQWNGQRKHLVVVGDVVDRGPDATRALWFLYGLEPQAERAGGRVHVVLGNHELMVMTGDLRYVAPKEQTLATLHGVPYPALFDPARSVLGQWMVSRPAVLRIGDVLFAHGGISAQYAGWSLNEIQDSLQAFTGEELFARWSDTTYAVPLDSAAYHRRWDFFWDERSPFWYRGYVHSDSSAAELTNVLRKFGAALHVIGHTPIPSIQSRYDARLIDVNTLPFVTEALLLVRRNRTWERFRIRETGPPSPL